MQFGQVDGDGDVAVCGQLLDQPLRLRRDHDVAAVGDGVEAERERVLARREERVGNSPRSTSRLPGEKAPG